MHHKQIQSPSSRVLILNAYSHFGGAENFILRLSQGLKLRGWKVFLGCRANSPFLEIAQKAGLSVRGYPFAGDADPRTLVPLSTWIRQVHPQLIFTTDDRSARIGGILAHRFGIPHIARLRSVWDPAQREPYWRRWRKGVIYRSLVDNVVTNSMAARENLIREFFLPAHMVKVIYNGVSCREVDVGWSPAQSRAHFGLPPQAFTIAVIGRIVPAKQQHVAVEAAKILFQEGIDFRLVLVGEAVNRQYYQALMEQIRHSPCQQRIQYLGPVYPIGKILPAVDVLLSPSIAEGLPNVFLEAACFRIPTIARDICGNGEFVRNGATGILLPAHATPMDFAQAIIKLHEEPLMRRQLGEQAFQLVQKQFSFNRMVHQYHSLFSSYMSADIRKAGA